MVGQIKKLNEKGFGFIKCKELNKDVFFYHKDVQNAEFDSLQEGDQVTFDQEKNEKGLIAKNVRLV